MTVVEGPAGAPTGTELGSDEVLRSEIVKRLSEALGHGAEVVSVAVSGAQVLLRGTVPDRHVRHAIEDLVECCPGVQDLKSELRAAADA